jgi:uncharacterized protein YbgA (DUF1722 family)
VANADTYSNVLSSLKLAIASVEKRIKKHEFSAQKKRKDGTVDHTSVQELANDLDDLYAARIVLNEMRHCAPGLSQPLLAEPWRAWVSILLWGGVCQNLESERIHKFRSDISLRSLFARNLITDPDKTKNGVNRLFHLQRLFDQKIQGQEVLASFNQKLKFVILVHQDRSYKGLQEMMRELSAYEKTLDCDHSGKKQKVKKLVEALEKRMAAYEGQIKKLAAGFLTQQHRIVLFQKNQQFFIDCLGYIRNAELEVHRDKYLKVILGNLIIALTGVGIFVIAARSIYAAFDSNVPIFFFAKTRGALWSDVAKQKLSDFGQVKQVEEDLQITVNPMYSQH